MTALCRARRHSAKADVSWAQTPCTSQRGFWVARPGSLLLHVRTLDGTQKSCMQGTWMSWNEGDPCILNSPLP